MTQASAPRSSSLPRVVSSRCCGAAIVLTNEVDDRVAADLFLPVAGDPQVDGQRSLLPEQLGGLQQREQLALVVGDAAGVVPAVAFGELEGR